jgi:hypothetical protein
MNMTFFPPLLSLHTPLFFLSIICCVRMVPFTVDHAYNTQIYIYVHFKPYFLFFLQVRTLTTPLVVHFFVFIFFSVFLFPFFFHVCSTVSRHCATISPMCPEKKRTHAGHGSAGGDVWSEGLGLDVDYVFISHPFFSPPLSFSSGTWRHDF